MNIRRTLRAPGSYTVADPSTNKDLLEGTLVVYNQVTDSISIPDDEAEANAVTIGNSYGGFVAVKVPVFNEEYWVRLSGTKSAGDSIGAFTLMSAGVKGQIVPAQRKFVRFPMGQGSMTVEDPSVGQDMTGGVLVTYSQTTGLISVPVSIADANAITVSNSFGGEIEIKIQVFNETYFYKLLANKSAGDIVGMLTIMKTGVTGDIVPAQKTIA